jgi:hypothetical protein
MRGIITVILLLCAPVLCAAATASDELQLTLTLIKGERSKDSSSTTQTISIKGRELVFDETYHGRRARGGKEPLHKVFQLEADELKTLIGIIRQRNLLDSGSKEFPSAEGYTYFDISLWLKVNGKESSIKLSGKTRHPDIKEDKLYQNTEALVKEIFSILQRKDESMRYRGISE